MIYKVINRFADIEDNYYTYEVGDTFPHSGVTPSEKRINDLLTKNNLQGKPLIVEERSEETVEVKPKRKQNKGSET